MIALLCGRCCAGECDREALTRRATRIQVSPITFSRLIGTALKSVSGPRGVAPDGGLQSE